MNKWAIGARHLVPSVCGWVRALVGHPLFAVKLLLARVRFFLTRKHDRPLVAPGGFPIDTPDALIAFWAIVIERELFHTSWVESLRRAERPVVLDIGANAGVFSYFIHTLRPGCEIIAFEPLPTMAAKVRVLTEKAAMNLTCHEVALSDTEGQAVMETAHGYDGTSRLAAPGKRGQNEGIRVRMTTLDRIAVPGQITLIKVDVEGFEPEVLAGGQETLRHTTHVIAEAHTDAHLNRITAALGEGWRSHQLGPCDYLFSRH